MNEDRKFSMSYVPTQQEKEILKQFRKTVQDILKPGNDDDDYLLRWLKARDFDLVKAEAMIRHSYKFMYNIEADNLLDSGFEPSKFALRYLSSNFLGFDKDGSPIRLFLSGVNDYKGFCRALTAVDIMKYLAYVMNNDIKAGKENAKKTGKYNPKIVYIFDFTNFSIKCWLDKLVVQKGIATIAMYQDNFPELLKIAYVVNVPPIFQVAVNVFKSFITEKTWQKIKIYSTDDWKDDLLQHVDVKFIPKHLGGMSDTNESYSDPFLFLKTTNGGKIPTKYYLKEDSYIKSTDPKVQSIVIQDRGKYDYKININKCGAVIKWIFQTKNNNIKFGVFFTPFTEDKDAVSSEIIKSRVIDSQVIPERGELYCDKIGTYILQFDNTYSWLVKKHILLKTEVV